MPRHVTPRPRKVGQLLRYLRELAGVNMGELAEMLGVSVTAVSQVELGKYPPDCLFDGTGRPRKPLAPRLFVVFDPKDGTYHRGAGDWHVDEAKAQRYLLRREAEAMIDELDGGGGVFIDRFVVREVQP